MLSVQNLVKSFGSVLRGRDGRADRARVTALDHVGFEVGAGEFFTLLGPSGCGKTTTLRSIAGLEEPDSGAIVLDGRVLYANGEGRRRVNLAARERGLGMVFQSYAIWPHLRTFDNVAFPLVVQARARRLSKAAIRDRVGRVLEMMDLAALADRPATDLSGGQQQRVALARAIVTEPPLLLLDEPLSNLDAKLRESLRFEFKRLQRDLNVTTIYVTHDQAEALALSSTVAIMRAGSVVQLGSPRDLYDRPADTFVAGFLGSSNMISGSVRGIEPGKIRVDCDAGSLLVDADGDTAPGVGSPVTVVARPDAVRVTVEPPIGAPNVWRGRVVTQVYLGDGVECLVRIGEQELLARGDPRLALEPEAEVHLSLDPARLVLVTDPHASADAVLAPSAEAVAS
jgi:iron(III) transport system ATP-binding protein